MKKILSLLFLLNFQINSEKITIQITYQEKSYISWTEKIRGKVIPSATIKDLKNTIKRKINKKNNHGCLKSLFNSPITRIDFFYEGQELTDNEIISAVMKKFNLVNELNLEAEVYYD